MSNTTIPINEPGSTPEARLRDISNGSDQEHFTAGFTIPDIYNLLPASSSVDKDLVGWMFLFSGDGEEPMQQIEIKKLWKSTISGFSVLFTTDFITAGTIVPHICQQVPRTYSPVHSIPYQAALSLTQTIFTPNEDLLISDLDHYRSWAEATFIRRTDLDFLRSYLGSSTNNNYNDVFFSGAEVKYSTMHNPRMRVQQHNYPGPGLIYDTGHAFTLKAEPFNATAQPQPQFNEIQITESVQQELKKLEGLGSPAMAPAAFMMIPCPDFWEVSQGIAMAMAEGDFWFGNRLVPNVQETLTPSAIQTLIRTSDKVNTVNASIVLQFASFLRNTVGNTP